jgi:hypothetical protein
MSPPIDEVDSRPGSLRVKRSLGPARSTGAGEGEILQRRVRLLAGLCAGVFGLVALLGFLIPGTGPGVELARLGAQVTAAALLLWWLVRRPFPTARLRAMTVAFVLLVALALALVEIRLVPAVADDRFGISGIGLWLVLALVLMPLPPVSAALTALGGAALVPLLWMMWSLLGMRPCPPGALLAWWLPVAVCAGLGWFAAWRLHCSDQALADARRELRELGRYELVRRLGGGGMGEVWLGRHRLLPRQAAIKLIRPPTKGMAADRDAAERTFRAEASAVSRLTSVHTVTLFDYGVSDEGEWYQVMELIDGVNLHQLVRRWGPLPDWRVVRILAHVCRSLAEAHGMGLVHRDIKPGNIMLCRLGGEIEIAKVLDFGLVQPRGVVLPDEAQSWAGTPGYVAPEVMEGRPADGRADLYSLGCVAWWLLAGERVMPAADGYAEAQRHGNEPAPALLSRVPSCDPDLAHLIDQLLAKVPHDRPMNAEVLHRNLVAAPCWGRRDEQWLASFWRDELPPEIRG